MYEDLQTVTYIQRSLKNIVHNLMVAHIAQENAIFKREMNTHKIKSIIRTVKRIYTA